MPCHLGLTRVDEMRATTPAWGGGGRGGDIAFVLNRTSNHNSPYRSLSDHIIKTCKYQYYHNVYEQREKNLLVHICTPYSYRICENNGLYVDMGGNLRDKVRNEDHPHKKVFLP